MTNNCGICYNVFWLLETMRVLLLIQLWEEDIIVVSSFFSSCLISKPNILLKESVLDLKTYYYFFLFYSLILTFEIWDNCLVDYIVLALKKYGALKNLDNGGRIVGYIDWTDCFNCPRHVKMVGWIRFGLDYRFKNRINLICKTHPNNTIN